MARRPIVLLSCALVVSLTVLLLMGQRVLERDREALYSGFGHDREQGIEEAARGLGDEVADIDEDLDLASTLLQGETTAQFAERELHAIATIKREYLVMHARTEDGQILRVTAYDAPPGVAELADRTLEDQLTAAARDPGRLHVSGPFVESGTARWYRVFARRSKDHGPTIAVVVDVSVLLRRMKVQRDPTTRLVILDASGAAAPVSDPTLSRIVREQGSVFVPVLAKTMTGASAVALLEGDTARSIGLPRTPAVAIAVPLFIEGSPWVLLVVASTQTLQTQEHTIVRRVVLGGALVLVLLLSAAAYVLHNTFRARGLRERIEHLSEMRRIEQRLLHSEKLVTAGQLAAGIAHEIGTPLNVARGRVELSLAHLGEAHAEAGSQRIAIDQIDRVTRLIQQLLDYVRPAPGATQDIDVVQSLRAVKDLLGPQAAKRDVTIQIASSDPCIVRADPDQVQQVIVNLVLNAIDACEPGGHATLGATARDQVVLVEVSDDGPGIPPEIQKQVFDPFFTTKKRGQGTGLGLWVVAQILRAQSAEIEIDSEVGNGTTVRISWPVT